MTREEAIGRLCAVMGTVNEQLTGWEEPADCVCPPGADGGPYRNSGTAIEFVEAAVFEALARRGIE